MRKLHYYLIILTSFFVLSCQLSQKEEKEYVTAKIENFPENVEYILFEDGNHWSSHITEAGSYKLEEFEGEARIHVSYKTLDFINFNQYFAYGNLIDDSNSFKIFVEDCETKSKKEIDNSSSPLEITNEYSKNEMLSTNIIDTFIGTFSISNEMSFSFLNTPRLIAGHEVRLSKQDENRYYYIDMNDITNENFWCSLYDYSTLKRGTELKRLHKNGLYYVDKYFDKIEIYITPAPDYEVISSDISMDDQSFGELTKEANKFYFTPAKTQGIAAQGGITVKFTGAKAQLCDPVNFANKTLVMKSYEKSKTEAPELSKFTMKFYDTSRSENSYRALDLSYNEINYTGNWMLRSKNYANYTIILPGSSHTADISYSDGKYTAYFYPIDQDYYYVITLEAE